MFGTLADDLECLIERFWKAHEHDLIAFVQYGVGAHDRHHAAPEQVRRRYGPLAHPWHIHEGDCRGHAHTHVTDLGAAGSAGIPSRHEL